MNGVRRASPPPPAAGPAGAPVLPPWRRRGAVDPRARTPVEPPEHRANPQTAPGTRANDGIKILILNCDYSHPCGLSVTSSIAPRRRRAGHQMTARGRNRRGLRPRDRGSGGWPPVPAATGEGSPGPWRRSPGQQRNCPLPGNQADLRRRLTYRPRWGPIQRGTPVTLGNGVLATAAGYSAAGCGGPRRLGLLLESYHSSSCRMPPCCLIRDMVC